MRVKAKRLGWDEKLTPVQILDMDPYDKDSDNLEGELKTVEVPASEYTPAMTLHLVNGHEADPKTIKSIDD